MERNKACHYALFIGCLLIVLAIPLCIVEALEMYGIIMFLIGLEITLVSFMCKIFLVEFMP